MANPQYFLPNLELPGLVEDNRLRPDVLARYHLDATFADTPGTQDPADVSCVALMGPGPDGLPGVMLSAPSSDGKQWVGYFPDKADSGEHQWTRFGDGERLLYVGINTANPVTPDDLERKVVYPGYQIQLAGHSWSIPVIRDPAGSSGLPTDWPFGDDGQIEPCIRADYAALWGDMEEVVDFFFAVDSPDTMDRTPAVLLCLKVLGINHRVNRYLQNLLGLITSGTWADILLCAVDGPAHRDLFDRVMAEKKRLAELEDTESSGPEPTEFPASPDEPPESIDTSPGSAAFVPGTSQAVENSTPPALDGDAE